MIELSLDSSSKSRLLRLCLHYCKLQEQIKVIYQENKAPYLHLLKEFSQDECFSCVIVILKYLVGMARGDKSIALYNTRNLEEESLINEWLIFASKLDFDIKSSSSLQTLNEHLESRTFLCSTFHVTLADLVLFASVYDFIKMSTTKELRNYFHLCRWFDHIQYDKDIQGGVLIRQEILFPIISLEDIFSYKDFHIPSSILQANTPVASTQKKTKSDPQKKLTKEIETKRVDTLLSQTERAIDDPTRLNLRVGKIVKCWTHPDAEKLLCFNVDVGEKDLRLIVSGIRQYYTVEELSDRLVVVLCNLKSKKLVGFSSHGMLLCGKGQVSTDQTCVELVKPPNDSKIGERIQFEGLQGEPDEVLSNKKGKDPFLAVLPNLHVLPDHCAAYKEFRMMTTHGACICPSLIDGTVS